MDGISTYASTIEIWLDGAYEDIEIAFQCTRDFSIGLIAEKTFVPYSHLECAVTVDWDTDTSDVESDGSHSQVRTLMRAMREIRYKAQWLDMKPLRKYYAYEDLLWTLSKRLRMGTWMTQWTASMYRS